MKPANVIPLRPRGGAPDLAALARQWLLEEAGRTQAAESVPPASPAATATPNAEMLRLLRRIDRTLAKLQGSLQRGDLRSKTG